MKKLYKEREISNRKKHVFTAKEELPLNGDLFTDACSNEDFEKINDRPIDEPDWEDDFRPF